MQSSYLPAGLLPLCSVGLLEDIGVAESLMRTRNRNDIFLVYFLFLIGWPVADAHHDHALFVHLFDLNP